MLDGWTITIKQKVRFRERMHLEKFWLDQIQNGHYSLSHGRYMVNCARWLDQYYKTKCEISGEDTSWKILTPSNSKWPPINHYSFSHGRYLVNRARWLDHYTIKQNVSFRGRMHPGNFLLYRIQNGWQLALFTSIGLISGKHLEKKFDLIKFKIADYRLLFTFTWPLFGKPCRRRWADV